MFDIILIVIDFNNDRVAHRWITHFDDDQFLEGRNNVAQFPGFLRLFVNLRESPERNSHADIQRS